MKASTACKYGYGRCDYTSTSQIRLQTHYATKHADERQRSIAREKAERTRTLGFDGVRALHAGRLQYGIDEEEINNIRESNEHRIAENYRQIYKELAEAEKHPRLRTRREEDSPEPFNTSDEESEDEFAGMEKMIGVITEPEPSSTPETEDIDDDGARDFREERDEELQEEEEEGIRVRLNGDVGDNEYEVFRIVEHPTASKVYGHLEPSEMLLNEKVGPWAPFKTAYDFKFGSWLTRHCATCSMITEGFNRGILHQEGKALSFSSPHTLHKLTDSMEPHLSEECWRTGDAKFFSDQKNEVRKFYFRPIAPLIRHFFKQPAYREHLIYKPSREFNKNGERVYSDMHTGDWWWRKQSEIRVGGTVVPIIFASDATQLSTHAGDHDCWPIYMSVGNLPSNIRSRPSTNSWILVAVLPIAPKKDDSLELDSHGKPRSAFTREEKDKYSAYKDDVLHQVLEIILKPLQKRINTGMVLECADGTKRIGFPFVAAWIADYQEYSKLYQVSKDGCALCEVGFHQLGDNVRACRRSFEKHERVLLIYRKQIADRDALEVTFQERKKTHPRAVRPKELVELRKKCAVTEHYFKIRQSKKLDNTLFRSGVADSNDVWKPDILHTIYQGMLKHILTWLKKLLEKYNRYAQFNQIWLRIPAFLDLPEHKKTIGGNSQMTGKLLRNVLKCLLPCVVITLDDPSEEEKSIFTEVIACIRYFVDFALVCRYKRHTATSIGYLETYLEGFHRHKKVFEPFKGNGKKKAKNRESDEETLLRAEQIMKKRKHELSRQATALLKDLTPKQVRDMLGALLPGDQGLDEIGAVIDRLAQKDGDGILKDHGMFTVIKLHLLSHFAETVREFGALQQYSTEIGETLHKGLKEAYRFSNKNNIAPQILRYHTRRFAIRMRELNLLQLAKDGRYALEIQDVLALYGNPDDKRLAAKLAREGKAPLATFLSVQPPDPDAFKPATTKEQRQKEHNNDNPEPEVDRIHFPVPRPLFKQLTPLKADRRFHAPLRSGTSRLAHIQSLYELPFLAEAVKDYIDQEPAYKAVRRLNITVAELEKLPTLAWTSIQITTPALQEEDGYEILKAVCTGRHAKHRRKPRNDSILFREYDSDEEKDEVLTSVRKKAGTRRRKTAAEASDFGPYALGHLKCLFKLTLPKPQYWKQYRLGNGSIPDSHSRSFRFAFVEVLKPRRAGPWGEMEIGSELARCVLPDPAIGVYESNLARRGGRILEVKSIVRTAHCIPVHIDPNAPREERAWIFNNRIDIGTWDMIYGNVN